MGIMTIFNQLESWFFENRGRLEAIGISVTFVKCKPTENTAAYFDVDTKTMVARATVWESMEINFEAIEGRSGKDVIAENHHVQDMQEAFRLLEGFFARLS